MKLTPVDQIPKMNGYHSGTDSPCPVSRHRRWTDLWDQPHEKQPQSWRHEETVIPWTMPQTLNRVCGFLCPKFNTQSNDIISSSADWR